MSLHASRRRFLAASLAAGLATSLRPASLLAGPEIPGAPQTKPILLQGATLHPVSGPALTGDLLFDAGRITALGAGVTVPAGAEVVAAAGKHVYPGLIDAYCQLGLIEIASVRATIDTTETGNINPNVQARRAFNPDSELLPVTRANGVLSVHCAPTGGLIAGQSSVMVLDGWTWEDMTLRSGVGMHVAWPRFSLGSGGPFGTIPEGINLPAQDTEVRLLADWLAQARDYAKARAAVPTHPFNIRLEALVPVVTGALPLWVSADDVREIRTAVLFAQREKVKLVILGGYDAPLCADLLKAHDVPVVVAGTTRLPRRGDDPVDQAFSVPARLAAAGVKFCISGADRDANNRNLPYHAGVAAAHGLSRDLALRSVTLSAAEILGVADRIGSLQAGKDATLFIASGDPLDIPTQIEAAYIQGRKIDLSSRHTKLNDKYREKYRRGEKSPSG